YDSDCDEINSAKVTLMANLSHYGSNDLAEVHNQDNMTHNVINQAVQAIPLSEQSNINSNFLAQQAELILSVMAQLKTQVVNCTKINLDNKSVNETLTDELERYKDQKTNVIVIRGSEETLMLAEESHFKMLPKQKDPMMSEKKVNTKPVDYAALNQLSQDFETRYVSQTDLSTEQVFRSQNFVNFDEPNLSTRPTQVEVPKELLRTAHYDYPKYTQEETATLREIVKHKRSLNPLNTSLDYACKYTKRIQELLTIIKQTCTCIHNLGDKLMAVTPMNKTNKVRFTENVTSSGNKPIKTSSSLNVVSNKPMMSSTGVTLPTSASGSQPSKGLGHNLFSVGQFCDSDLEVPFRQYTCFICNLEGVDMLIESRGNNLYTLAINHLARQGLVQGLPRLKFEKDHLCSACAMGKSKKKSHKPKSEDTNQEKIYLLHMDLCGPMRVESVNGNKSVSLRKHQLLALHSKTVSLKDVIAVATACYTQNRSIVRLHHGKTPYELLHGKLPDLSFLHVFGALCYPTNDSENLGKLQPKADIDIFIGYAPIKNAFWIYNRCTRQIIETIHVDFDELTDILFHPLFDELLTPPPSVDPPAPAVIAPTDEDVEEHNHDIEVANMGNDSFSGIPIPEVASDQSSSTDSTHAIVHTDHQISQHNSKWTKDHPLENIIGQLARPVSTRLQLHEQALFCYSDAFLTFVEPKTFESCEPVDTPMVEKSKLDEDKERKAVDPSHYRGMIGTFLYLTAVDVIYKLLYACVPSIRLGLPKSTYMRSKHIDIEYHFIKEHVENGVIELYFVNTKYQLANIFTKALGRERIEFLIDKLGMRSFTPETLKQLTDEVDEVVVPIQISCIICKYRKP
nr:hypothetical protein [Tanacetum cinerariifolium]